MQYARDLCIFFRKKPARSVLHKKTEPLIVGEDSFFSYDLMVEEAEKSRVSLSIVSSLGSGHCTKRTRARVAEQIVRRSAGRNR